MYSDMIAWILLHAGFPIQKSPDQCLFSNSPKHIAAFHVFLRLLTPRHPPYALSSLATNYIFTFNTLNALFEFKSKLSKNYYLHFKKCKAEQQTKFFVYSSAYFFNDYLVEDSRIELLTSCVQGRRSPSWANPPFFYFEVSIHSWYTLKLLSVVGLDRIELSTSRLSGVRSNRTELQAPVAHL